MFKALDNKNKCWIESFILTPDGRIILKIKQEGWQNFKEIVVDSTLCRSTGRMEKDGKLVFEFDILQDYEGRIFLVKWCDYSCGFKLYNNGTAYLMGDVGQLIKIGNFFEHKHLLEAKQ